MSKHTKGPWYGADKPIFGWWTIYSNHSIGGTECLNGRQAIATIPAASKKNDPEYAEMFAANARLIAAAPELLTLLVESQDNIGGDWRERRDALIAKVKGQR